MKSSGHIFTDILFLLLTSRCMCQLTCPAAEINKQAELHCMYKDPSYLIFTSPSGDIAECRTNCSGVDHFNITLSNQTYSRLTIARVEWEDEGEWKCRFDNEKEKLLHCSLNLYKIPSCVISSNTDTSQVTLGEEMNLTMVLTEPYCTADNTFTLQTGNVNYSFTGQPSSDISRTLVSAFYVSESHIGSVSAKFVCGNQFHNLNCSGVNRLVRRSPPSCSINSSNPVDGVNLNDKITLTVDVEKYPCSGLSQFNLNIGDVQFHLAINTDEAVKKSITLTVAEAHFGDVNIGYTCNSVSRTVSCEGVNQLIQKSNSTSFIFIIIGVIGGMVASTDIIAFIVMWRKRFAKDKKNSKETRARTIASTDQPISTGQPSGHYSALHADPQHCRDLYKVIENEGETSTPIYVNAVSQEPDYITPV